MGIGRGLKERRWAEPQRGQNEAAGDLLADRATPGARAGEMERHHREGAGSGHTDHAPAAAAAPAPRAHAGAVAQCVKAQDSADAVSNQHHLGERRRHQEGLRRRQAGGGPPPPPRAPGGQSPCLTCPQKPVPSGERRKAA